MNQENIKYGFYDRLTEDFPSQIIADITERCNLACIHCPHEEFTKSEHYKGRNLDVELNKKLVDEVKAHGKDKCQYIRYTSNGEPLLHPKSYEMIEYAVKNSGTYVTLTTNATIMNEDKTRRLLDAGVHMVDISIDAFKEESYAKIRRNGNLGVTRNNVLNLINWAKESKSKTKVVVSFIEQPLNHGEADEFEKYWKDNGADFVIIRRLHSCGGAKVDIAKKLKIETSEIRRPCLYPWERIVLNSKGYLAFCPADWTDGTSLTDYRTTSIKELWNGQLYESLRQAHINNNFCNHKFCGQCPDWEATRWPDQGRSYADLIEDFTKDEEKTIAR